MFRKFILALLVLAAVAGGFFVGHKVGLRRLMPSQERDRNEPRPVAIPQVPEQLRESSRAFSDVVRIVGPAVVNISSFRVVEPANGTHPFRGTPFFQDFFDWPFRDREEPGDTEQGMGSGVIVSEDGLIITNNHVIEGADEIRVTLQDREEFPATVVGVDPKTDLAVLRIEKTDLATIPWGDSENLEVGEFVLAIGSPFGLSRTVTMGIISATGRANVGIADYEDFIQTDAAINPGNSGGPLVNIQGELIGINTAIFSRSGGYQGIGFAVPSNMARRIMEQLLSTGRVSRGWLGVTIQDITPDISRHFGLPEVRGALVGDVAPGSPAQEAGLQRGDILLEFSGKPVADVSSLRNLVASAKVGSEVSLLFWRDGEQLRRSTRIIEWPSENPEAVASVKPLEPSYSKEDWLGLKVMVLTREIRRQLGLAPGENGLVIVGVRPGSAGQAAGLRKGDVILEINRNVVSTLNEFDRAVSTAPGDQPLLLYIRRGERKVFVSVPPG